MGVRQERDADPVLTVKLLSERGDRFGVFWAVSNHRKARLLAGSQALGLYDAVQLGFWGLQQGP